MKISELNDVKETIGMVIPTQTHGNVEIIDFEPDEGFESKLQIYLNKARSDTFIGSMKIPWHLTGGAVIVKKTDKEATTFE